MSNLHTNNDIRCGLIMSVKINTAYVEYIYTEFENGGELKYIRGDNTIGDETSHTNNFWDEFSTKYCNMFEKWEAHEHDQELYYLFNEHLEDWKDYFIWYKCVDDLYYTDDESDSDSDDEPLVPIAEGYENEKGKIIMRYDDRIFQGEDGKLYRKTFDDDWNEILEEVEKPKRKIKIHKK